MLACINYVSILALYICNYESYIALSISMHICFREWELKLHALKILSAHWTTKIIFLKKDQRPTNFRHSTENVSTWGSRAHN